MSLQRTLFEYLETCIRGSDRELFNGPSVVELIGRQPDVAALENEFGDTLLMVAADACNVSVVKRLCDFGAEVDRLSETGQLPLVCAVRSECSLITRKETVEVLLRCGANPNYLGFMGCSALHWAALQGDVALVQVLLEHGADRGVRSGDRDAASSCEMVRSSRFRGADSARNELISILRCDRLD